MDDSFNPYFNVGLTQNTNLETLYYDFIVIIPILGLLIKEMLKISNDGNLGSDAVSLRLGSLLPGSLNDINKLCLNCYVCCSL